MARGQPIDLGSLVIPQDQQESSFIDFRKKPLRGIIIFAPLELNGAVTMEVSGNFFLQLSNPELITWQKLQSGGQNIPVGANQAVPLDFVGWDAFRLVSNQAGGESVERVFVVKGVEEL